MVTHLASYVKGDIYTYRQWVCWVYDGTSKIPIDAKTGKKAKPNDSRTWSTYHQAIEASKLRSLDGVGFVFSADDPYCGIDIDNCIVGGEVEQWAQEIVETLDSYAEISPSGTGIKIWVKAKKQGERCSTDYESGKVEIYDQRHFFTYTNLVYQHKPIQERQEALEALYATLFPQPDATPQKAISCATLDDETLLGKARLNPKFCRLYDQGYWTGYKSQSEADQALCGMLAFWTGCDEDQMVRLFLGSRLATYLDRKSDPDSYLERTVVRAIKNCNNVYDPNWLCTKSRGSTLPVVVRL